MTVTAGSKEARVDWRGILKTAALGAALLVGRSTLADHYHVPSGSMEPTLRVGDHLFVDKRAYGLRVPFTRQRLWNAPVQRGDVVVFDSPVDEEVWVKRVIAVPGDTVSFDGMRLRINGVPASQSPAPAGRTEALPGCLHPVYPEDFSGPTLAETRIPAGKYLVMGDHRGASLDGRTLGLLEEERLLGRVVSVLFTRREGVPIWKRWWLPLTDCRSGVDERLYL